MNAMCSDLSMGESVKFKGLYIDTCANRSSVMSYEQYKAYCTEFQVPVRVERLNMRRWPQQPNWNSSNSRSVQRIEACH